MKLEIEEQKEVAKSRQEELDNLQKTHTKMMKEYERLKLEVPNNRIVLNLLF